MENGRQFSMEISYYDASRNGITGFQESIQEIDRIFDA